jgi:hypothetical protein
MTTEHCTFWSPVTIFFFNETHLFICTVLPSDRNLYTFSLFAYTVFQLYAHDQPYISHTCSQATFHAFSTFGLGERDFIQNGLELGTARGVTYVSVIWNVQMERNHLL